MILGDVIKQAILANTVITEEGKYLTIDTEDNEVLFDNEDDLFNHFGKYFQTKINDVLDDKLSAWVDFKAQKSKEKQTPKKFKQRFTVAKSIIPGQRW